MKDDRKEGYIRGRAPWPFRLPSHSDMSSLGRRRFIYLAVSYWDHCKCRGRSDGIALPFLTLVMESCRLEDQQQKVDEGCGVVIDNRKNDGKNEKESKR